MGHKQDSELLKFIQQFMQGQLQQANTPDPNLQRLMGINNSILDWHLNKGNTIKDIYKHPLLGDKMPVFQMMRKNQDEGRIGRGVVGRTNLNNANYGADMKLEDDFNRSIASGGALEMGLQNESDQAQNNLMKLSEIDSNRKAGIIGGASSLGGYSLSLGQQVQNGGWGGFFRGILGGL